MRSEIKKLFIEYFILAIITGSSIYLLRGTLVYGNITYVHDNFNWALPIYSYFYKNFDLNYLHLNLWDPMVNGGESLISSYLQLRVLDPITWFIGVLGKIFSFSAIMQFHWDRYLKAMCGAFGIYILFRNNLPSLYARACLFSAIIFSSLIYQSFVQNGITDIFYSAPFIYFFLKRIILLKDNRWTNYLGASLFIGITFQSYFFSPAILFSLLIVACYPRQFMSSFKGNLGKYSISFLLLLFFASPMLVYVVSYSSDLFFIARSPRDAFNLSGSGPVQFFSNINLNYLPKTFLDYQIIAESGARNNLNTFLSAVIQGVLFPTQLFLAGETLIYFGILPFAIFILGIISRKKNAESRFWLISLIFFSILSFGSLGGFHQLLYKLFPFLMQFRHVHVLLGYILMSAMYFFSLGLISLLSNSDDGNVNIKTRGEIKPFFGLIILIISFLHIYFFDISVDYLVIGLYFLVIVAWRYPKFDILKLSIKNALIATILISLLCVVKKYTLDFSEIRSNYLLIIGIQVFVTIYCLSLIGSKRFLALIILGAVFYTAYVDLGYRYFLFGSALFLLVCLIFVVDLNKDILKPVIFLIILTDVFFNFKSQISKVTVNIPSIIRPSLSNFEESGNPIRRFAPSRENTFRVGPDRDGGQIMRYSSLFSGSEYSFIQAVNNVYIKKDQVLSDIYSDGVWNSFSMNKSLVALLYSGINYKVLEQIVGNRQPIYQIKANYRATKNVIDELRGGNINDLTEFLKEGIYIEDVDGTLDAALKGLRFSNQANISVIKSQPSNRIIDLSSEFPSIFYVVDGYDRNWKATIDGLPARIYRANENFKAIIVPAGQSRVELTYSPSTFLWAAFLFNFLSVCLTFFLMWFVMRRMKKLFITKIVT